MIQTNLRSQVLAILLSLVLCVSFAFAQKPTPTPERSHEIVALLNDARYAAPELTVDVLLKVIESKKIADPAWRREILDETFRTADEVKYPVRRERAYHGTGIVDTVSGYMTYAYEQNLDALSLKARIVKAWLREDKARARQMVFQIGGDLNLKPLICADAMGYEVTGIYASVGADRKSVV